MGELPKRHVIVIENPILLVVQSQIFPENYNLELVVAV